MDFAVVTELGTVSPTGTPDITMVDWRATMKVKASLAADPGDGSITQVLLTEVIIA